MTTDSDRLLKLLSDNPTRKYATYEIAAALGIQANTVQRCIHHNLRDAPISCDRRNGERVKEYWYVPECCETPFEGGTTAYRQLRDICVCGRSFWARDGLCTICGAVRSSDIARESQKVSAWNTAKQKK